MRLRVFAIVAVLLAAGRVLGAEPVHIGILGFRPAAEEQLRWQPLVDYLNNKINGFRFDCQVLGYETLENAIAERSVDFVLTNPGHYVLMTHRNGMSSPLTTLVPIEHGRALSSFGGVVFTRAEQGGIRHLADLRGRTIAATTIGSFGGYQAQARALLELDIRVSEDARLIQTGMPHDRVVAAVLDGKAEAGFVRSGVLEAMTREGKLDLRRIRVLDPRKVPDFPFLLTTALYPEWPFAAMPGVDGDLARQVAAALLALPHDGNLARRLNIRGFNIPSDYEPVRATLEALRLPPYDTAPVFTVSDIWEKYRWQAVVGAALVGVITLLSIWLGLLNRRLAVDQRQLDRQAQAWLGLLTAMGEGVYGLDSYGRCSFVNPAALAMLGFTAEELIGEDVHALIHHHREDGTPYPSEECPVSKTRKDAQVRHAEDWFIAKDGTIFPVAVTIAPVSGDGQRGIVVVFRDISEHRRLETELREEAATDALTELPNRRYFLAEAERHVARMVRSEEHRAAVMMLDLDHFKIINDTHGHAAGDEVLRHLASLLREILRKGDLVGRLGGEEFAVLQINASAEEALQLAERLRQRIEASAVPAGGRDLHYTASIGVTSMAASDASVRAALQRADTALYRAKRLGRNRVEWEMPVAPSQNTARITSR
ncbi:MAG: diguanylate cyclase [Gammaproteobacteria bacterium]|nr:diguanylate cyclase [Gammaproteobacteria bacterium]MBU1416473.1 diguanylate cyclase [Gammaproteobacteria bacterium]